MNGRQAKAIRRSAKRAISADVQAVCGEFLNSLTELPLRRRLWYAARIVFRRKVK